MTAMGGSGDLIAAVFSSGILPVDNVSEYVKNGRSNDMAVDGSIKAIPFTYTPPIEKNLLVARIILYMESRQSIISGNFIHLSALENGVRISAGGVILTNWKDNIDIICDMFDFSNAEFSDGRKSFAGRWTFTKGAAGEPLKIFSGETFEVLIRDDLVGLVFRLKIQGKLVDA